MVTSNGELSLEAEKEHLEEAKQDAEHDEHAHGSLTQKHRHASVFYRSPKQQELSVATHRQRPTCKYQLIKCYKFHNGKYIFMAVISLFIWSLPLMGTNSHSGYKTKLSTANLSHTKCSGHYW